MANHRVCPVRVCSSPTHRARIEASATPFVDLPALPPFGGRQRAEVAGDFGQAIADVRAHGGIGGAGVARHERRRQPRVKIRRQRRVPRPDVEQPVQDQHVIAFDRLGQQRAARVLGDAHVQSHVLAVHLETEGGVVASSRASRVNERIDLARPGASSARRSAAVARSREQPRRLRFERFAQLVEVADVGLGRHAHARAGARARFDQAIRLEPAQRVA